MIYSEELKQNAILHRNNLWKHSGNIPKWVDIDTVSLDQFFTKISIAKRCYKHLLSILEKESNNSSNYKFIEPSAGNGSFYDLLPNNRRIGIDVMPLRNEFIKDDFLNWQIEPNCLRYVTIGNPPFGYRAWLALAFMNHAATFSDYVGMILPMAFQSDGKGSPKHRVQGLQLLHSETLPQDSFIDPYGKTIKVNGLWQVWKKGENIKPKPKTCNQWIELFTVDQRKERLCGHERMHKADYFLQRTFYKDPPTLVTNFSDVKYVCGYGMIIKKEKEHIIALLRSINWRNYSNLAAHNCRHISMYHIQKALTDAGYSDD